MDCIEILRGEARVPVNPGNPGILVSGGFYIYVITMYTWKEEKNPYDIQTFRKPGIPGKRGVLNEDRRPLRGRVERNKIIEALEESPKQQRPCNHRIV